MRLAYFTLVILAFFSSCTREKPLVEFETAHLKIGVSDKGSILELTDLNTGKNYISMDTLAPLISCRIDSQMYYPEKASFSDGTLNISFKGDLIVSIKVIQQATHITFELIEFNRTEDLDLVVWGPIPNTINEVIGETVGVVQGKKFALVIQSLNPKTLGGYPWTDNDCTPQFDIFEQEDYSDLSEENKREVLYRIEAAKPEKFGSSLQAYCRNRNKERIINNLNHERYVSPVFNDGGIIGSKIDFFG